jgi:tRNA (pseudouridine54-N1)-methyltransferase
VRRFVVIGQRASASAQFSLEDLPSSSGRLDVLLRCLRAALLVSHGLRRDALVYLLLGGGPRAPRVLRFDGSTARYLRPDERSLAVLAQKALAAPAEGLDFAEVRPGVAVADCGLDALLASFGNRPSFVLEEGARDVREVAELGADPLIFVGDHLGFETGARAALTRFAATPISVGPLSLHAEDAVTLVSNELDRREHGKGDPNAIAEPGGDGAADGPPGANCAPGGWLQ